MNAKHLPITEELWYGAWGNILNSPKLGVRASCVQSHAIFMIPKRENWLILRERLDLLIKPCTWENATLIKELFELCEVIQKAYPELIFSIEDLRLALHDLNIPFERNEHNDKFYYLGIWV